MIALEQNVHDHFEELCALAALGQITEREFVELQTHLEVCPSCRVERADYVSLMHHKLPLLIERERKSVTRAGSLRNFLTRSRKLEKQFLARAHQNGWRFSESIQPAPSFLNRFSALIGSLSYKTAMALMLAFLLASIAVLWYSLHVSNARNATLALQMSKLGGQNAAIQQQSDDAAESGALKTVVSPKASSKSEEISPAADLLAAELSKARDEHATALTRIQALESQLQAESSEAQSLRTQVETSKGAGSELERKLRETEASISQMNEEIQKLRSMRSGDTEQIAAERARVNELSERLKAQTETLSRERSLLAAGRDIRDLMGARNLHILDVFDVDGRGKSKRTFGRVFYTEGKSLIFYAFDLGDKKGSPLTKASFQAWGYHASNERSYESLGIFYVDDKNQNRWVLKFDDSNVLSHIDSVFVTIEPSGGSPKPTGHKLLYAYLNNRPNHP